MYLPENFYNVTLISSKASRGRVSFNTTFLCQVITGIVSTLCLTQFKFCGSIRTIQTYDEIKISENYKDE